MLGTISFRRSLATFLAKAYRSPVSPHWLLTTNGASHGLDLAVRALAKPGDTIVCEEPTYYLAAQIFRDQGLSIETIPSDGDGFDVKALAARLALHDRATPRLIYLVPSHGNPTGGVLAQYRRSILVALARRHGVHILADEVYQLLDYTEGNDAVAPRMLTYDEPHRRHGPSFGVVGSPPPSDDESEFGSRAPSKATTVPAGGQDEEGNIGYVISVGSFAKILAPGLRLGWLEAPPELLKQIATRGYMFSGGGLAPYVSQVVAELLDGGEQDAELRRLCATYAASASVLCEALRAEPALFKFEAPKGGYFVWVQLPEGVDAEELLPLAEKNGVIFLPGSRCVCDSVEPYRRYVRLCFALEEPQALREGVVRLAKAVRELTAL
eukprot:TRINITY_DN1773_c0_g1_i3.p1 TRINITY_DN1773_c0_g1~~TRINITY_DN1773_c0_g1_i3.p1  ORF type:complete len:382 (-),score=65.09 TRINITY_DN1773_c0_g1_i3:74-1219(-)